MVPSDRDMCKDPQPVTVQRCKVPCKRDCLVSHWARWGPCMPHNNTDFLAHIDSGKLNFYMIFDSCLYNFYMIFDRE